VCAYLFIIRWLACRDRDHSGQMNARSRQS
jgi:hypothetical protein